MNEKQRPSIRFKGFTEYWEQRKISDYGDFYYGHSCPKWSVSENATTPCVRYGELYTKFGTKINQVYSYTNMPPEKLRFSKGTEVLIPRVGEDPMDYNHCTWLSLSNVAIGEMISVYNTNQNPQFTAIMFNATLQKQFAMRVEGGSVTNLYFEKLKDIDISFPSIKEQCKITTYFSSLDHLITLYKKKYSRLVNIKKSMLEKMFPKNDANVPEIRFNVFNNNWKPQKLGEIVERVIRKNINNESSLPLTISAQYGLVDQITYFNNRVASQDISNYYLVLNGDFAYNKSTSDGFPFGAVKRLDLYEKGVLSTLYIVFSIKNQNETNSDFLKVFFDTNRWHKGVAERATEGARNHGLLNMKQTLKKHLSKFFLIKAGKKK